MTFAQCAHYGVRVVDAWCKLALIAHVGTASVWASVARKRVRSKTIDEMSWVAHSVEHKPAQDIRGSVNTIAHYFGRSAEAKENEEPSVYRIMLE